MLTRQLTDPKCQEGESLLSALQSLHYREDVDSRTEVFQRSIARSIEQVLRELSLFSFIITLIKVGYWLEQLHDRRVEATRIYDRIKDSLNRKLKSLDIAVMIDQYSNIVQDIRRRIERVDTVDKDVESCQEQLTMMILYERELQDVSDKCVKLVSVCESLDNNLYGDISMESSLHAYDILQLCTDLTQLVQLKMEIINAYVGLLQDYQNSSQKLEQIEEQIQSQTQSGTLSKDFSGEIKIILDSFLLKGQKCLDNSSDMKSSAG